MTGMGIVDLIQVSGGFMATVVLPLIMAFQFYDSKKRKSIADAKKAEAESISSYADEWKSLYEKKEIRVKELEEKLGGKIDKLYEEINALRELNNNLKEELHADRMKLQELEITKCKKRGCKDRIPPSEY